MNRWTLPESVEIGGVEYRINADFRDVLDIIRRISDPESDSRVVVYVALALFYEDFDKMPDAYYGDAAKWMMEFINCGEEPDGKTRPKTIDWEQDLPMIVSDINKVAHVDVRSLPFCHWWTFISWFNGIGEGQLSTVVAIREKRRKGQKLEKWEKDFFRENREKIEFKQRFTKAEEDFLKQWI